MDLPGLTRLANDYQNRFHDLALKSCDLRDDDPVDTFIPLPLCLGPCGGYRTSRGFKCCERCRGSYNSAVKWAGKQLLAVSSRMRRGYASYPDITLDTKPPTPPNIQMLDVVVCTESHCWKPSVPTQVSLYCEVGADVLSPPFVITHDADDLIHIRHPRGTPKFYIEHSHGEVILKVELVTPTTREVWCTILSGVRYTSTHTPGTVLYHVRDQCYQICSKIITKC